MIINKKFWINVDEKTWLLTQKKFFFGLQHWLFLVPSSLGGTSKGAESGSTFRKILIFLTKYQTKALFDSHWAVKKWSEQEIWWKSCAQCNIYREVGAQWNDRMRNFFVCAQWSDSTRKNAQQTWVIFFSTAKANATPVLWCKVWPVLFWEIKVMNLSRFISNTY